MPKTVEACSVDGCKRNRKSIGLCETHYYRLRRTGTTETRARRVPLSMPSKYGREASACIVEHCLKIDTGAHGLCSMHYSRMLRHGSTDTPPLKRMPAGADHQNWTGDRPSYYAAHLRIKVARGLASQFACPCGKRAQQWAYDHIDPNELHSVSGAYSADPQHYDARCVSCHKRADLALIKAARE